LKFPPRDQHLSLAAAEHYNTWRRAPPAPQPFPTNNKGMSESLVLAPRVILCTLNAKYIHASLGLRYLLANMGELRGVTLLREFTIARDPQQVAAELLATFGTGAVGQTQILGLGV